MYQPTCVLITGCAGFIGSNVTVYLVQKYPDIRFVGFDCISYCASVDNFAEISSSPNWKFYKGNLLEADDLDRVFRENTIDTVLHYAAYSHVDASFLNSIEFTKNNVLGTHMLLEYAKRNQIKRFIHVSTDECYGDSDSISTESSTLNPSNPYSGSKSAAEMMVLSYMHSFKLPIIITRGNNVYGEKQFPEKCIPRFILRLMSGQKCQIQGSGKQKRSFMFISDVITAFETLLFKGECGHIYNVGTTEEHTVLDVAERLVKILKPGEPVENWIDFVEDRPFNDQRYFISSEKLNKLGWQQIVDFDDGLHQTVEWYRSRVNQWNI